MSNLFAFKEYEELYERLANMDGYDDQDRAIHHEIMVHLVEALRLMVVGKGDERSELARRYQVAITDLEKVFVYVENWVERALPELPMNDYPLGDYQTGGGTVELSGISIPVGDYDISVRDGMLTLKLKTADDSEDTGCCDADCGCDQPEVSSTTVGYIPNGKSGRVQNSFFIPQRIGESIRVRLITEGGDGKPIFSESGGLVMFNIYNALTGRREDVIGKVTDYGDEGATYQSWTFTLLSKHSRPVKILPNQIAVGVNYSIASGGLTIGYMTDVDTF